MCATRELYDHCLCVCHDSFMCASFICASSICVPPKSCMIIVYVCYQRALSSFFATSVAEFGSGFIRNFFFPCSFLLQCVFHSVLQYVAVCCSVYSFIVAVCCRGCSCSFRQFFLLAQFCCSVLRFALQCMLQRVLLLVDSFLNCSVLFEFDPHVQVPVGTHTRTRTRTHTQTQTQTRTQTHAYTRAHTHAHAYTHTSEKWVWRRE